MTDQSPSSLQPIVDVHAVLGPDTLPNHPLRARDVQPLIQKEVG
jgi:hypothetical protein